MLVIGDKLIHFENIFFISSIQDIKNTKANSTLIFNYDEVLLKYVSENSISSAVIVTSIKEAIYANCLNAKYIISNQDLAKEIQKIADNYMFDSKNLAIIKSNDEFEQIAKNEIDGAIYEYLLELSDS
ncbi:conserved hypothetical protein [Aliarcobacter butzleri RM4018]|uniref:Uncharacterized protein n=1 Tax=Aliarcobacter butzleri (strain RM4018) TaxID=367737 RepID=A8EU67_ALIB4|nr:hypothetical protein [Aliarcobacter butzleri]ABV67491.1 conserved hypothetical protein [Aliarcobacter butzleri RM4018]GGT74017.1 hypothetical protein GCM10007985_07310 [Aliarcobacter butzleri]SNV28964.1 Uncharacterised protein [Aliarcobacter butzleri]